jgi:hypothetical protein
MVRQEGREDCIVKKALPITKDGKVLGYMIECPACGFGHAFWTNNPDKPNTQWLIRQWIYQIWRTMKKVNNNPMRAAHYRFNRLSKQSQAAKTFFRIGKFVCLITIGEICVRLCEKVTRMLSNWPRSKDICICYKRLSSVSY